MNSYFFVDNIEHFALDECVCPCCNEIILDKLVYLHLIKLDKMRKEYGFPLVITSGHRCDKHNKEVRGAKNSWHLRFATDVRPEIGREEDLHKLYKLALTMEWGGIGLYDSWIHLDMRPTETRWRG